MLRNKEKIDAEEPQVKHYPSKNQRKDYDSAERKRTQEICDWRARWNITLWQGTKDRKIDEDEMSGSKGGRRDWKKTSRSNVLEVAIFSFTNIPHSFTNSCGF